MCMCMSNKPQQAVDRTPFGEKTALGSKKSQRHALGSKNRGEERAKRGHNN